MPDHVGAGAFLRVDEVALECVDQAIAPTRSQRVLGQLEHRALVCVIRLCSVSAAIEDARARLGVAAV